VEATSAVPEPAPMKCAITGCDLNTRDRMPMVVPCPCGHVVCRKCLEVWAGMPEPGLCLACKSKQVLPSDLRDCYPATGVLVVLVAQLPALERRVK
jgi:hypothetical protein